MQDVYFIKNEAIVKKKFYIYYCDKYAFKKQPLKN